MIGTGLGVANNVDGRMNTKSIVVEVSANGALTIDTSVLRLRRSHIFADRLLEHTTH